MKFRIGHIGKFGQTNSNMDEEAIGHALESLGHEVYRMREVAGRGASNFERLKCDFVLCHKWSDFARIEALRIPVVCWYFDLIDFGGDPSLEPRNRKRREWMQRMTAVADLVFCTDGDWVAQDKSGKLYWLPQGADERVVGIGTPPVGETHPPILFTGISAGGGRDRENFVAEMRAVWGDSFHHVSSGYYRERLRDLVAASKVVVCPDSPVTDRYFSNRVYVAAGFGACIVHPYCERLAAQYADGLIWYYQSRDELHRLIQTLLDTPMTREETGEHVLKRTKAQHTYTHRCAELIRAVKERLF